MREGEAERLHVEAKLLFERLVNINNDRQKIGAKLRELDKSHTALKIDFKGLQRKITENDTLILNAAKVMRDVLKNPLNALKIILEQGREVWGKYYSESNLRTWAQEGDRSQNRNRSREI